VSISNSEIINALFLLAPQFQTANTTQLDAINQLISLIQCQVNQKMLACCGVMVFAFLLAHYLTLSANQNLGVAASQAEGDLSISYNVSPDQNALLLTPYGRSYLDLIKRTVIGSTVTNLPISLGGVYTNGLPTVYPGQGFWF
jgi:hypothetical protein